jgi:hypothetical protein
MKDEKILQQGESFLLEDVVTLNQLLVSCDIDISKMKNEKTYGEKKKKTRKNF